MTLHYSKSVKMPSDGHNVELTCLNITEFNILYEGIFLSFELPIQLLGHKYIQLLIININLMKNSVYHKEQCLFRNRKEK